MRTVVLIQTGSSVIVVSLLCGLSMVEAAPVRVRLPEGNARNFLVLRSLDGHDIAHGELRLPTMEVSIDRKTGRYEAVMQETKDKEEKRSSGRFEMPADLSKNLPRIGAAFQFAAFTRNRD